MLQLLLKKWVFLKIEFSIGVDFICKKLTSENLEEKCSKENKWTWLKISDVDIGGEKC